MTPRPRAPSSAPPPADESARTTGGRGVAAAAGSRGASGKKSRSEKGANWSLPNRLAKTEKKSPTLFCFALARLSQQLLSCSPLLFLKLLLCRESDGVS